VRTRPTFTERMSPEPSSTAICCMTAGNDIANGRASLLTELGQLGQDRPPGRIGERLKGQVEPDIIVKHVFKCSGGLILKLCLQRCRTTPKRSALTE
jgi:hypothetical protein